MVDGARFCHKCGKPQFVLLVPEEEVHVPTGDAVVAEAIKQQPLEISFHNKVAVRTALLTALFGSFLGQLPIPPQEVWVVASLVLAGFLAVFLYQRRTGQVLTVIA